MKDIISRAQNSKLKIQNNSQFSNSRIITLVYFCALCFVLCASPALAQQKDETKLVILSKQIMEAKSPQDLIGTFEELKDLYFKDNRYNEFLSFLGSLAQKKENLKNLGDYYIALTRYRQLEFLEEKKNWDEYFSKGDEYRQELLKGAQGVIDSTTVKDPLYIYAKTLLWQYHKDQQDQNQEELLLDLINGTTEYAKDAINLAPIKDLADKLLASDQKTKATSLYRIYVEKLIASGVKDEELKNTAADFYQQGKLELAEELSDAYLSRVIKTLPKDKAALAVIDIAKLFCYQDKETRDPFYAEKLFKQAQELGGDEIFDQGLMYLRAYNLEKSKEYAQTQALYLNLLKRYPDIVQSEEIEFKCGLISTYVLRDIKAGRGYFEKLAAQEKITPQVISSLYQLGLLSQWEGQTDKAKEYYNKLLEKAKDNFSDIVISAKDRLKEIEETKPIEYNLKTFLDVSLKDEYNNLDMSKIEIKPSLYKLNRGQELEITSSAYQFATGCMQVETRYLWSGDIGRPKSLEFPAFNTIYADSGIKELNLVVVTPSGILDRSLDILDVN